MSTGAGGFVHEGLFYEDERTYLAGTVPFVETALTAGQPALVAVPGPNLERIRGALGPVVSRDFDEPAALAGLRELAAEQARQAGLPDRRGVDLQIAVTAIPLPSWRYCTGFRLPPPVTPR